MKIDLCLFKGAYIFLIAQIWLLDSEGILGARKTLGGRVTHCDSPGGQPWCWWLCKLRALNPVKSLPGWKPFPVCLYHPEMPSYFPTPWIWGDLVTWFGQQNEPRDTVPILGFDFKSPYVLLLSISHSPKIAIGTSPGELLKDETLHGGGISHS